MSEEMSNCTRRCHERTYCAWEEWKSWGECSVSCGDTGKRGRVRYLQAYRQPPQHLAEASSEGLQGVQGFDELEAKFNDLKSRAQTVESRRLGELAAAFALGSLSFMGFLAMGQRFSRGLSSTSGTSNFVLLSTQPSVHRYTAAPLEEPMS